MSVGVAPGNSLARAEECIARKEREIHQQLMSLSDLRSKRNFLVPAFRLPPETLENIFIHAARDYHESYDGGRFTTRTPSWVNVSYVCSYWRKIALNCSALWAYHFNVSLRWTEELLLRSKEALLKISCRLLYGQEISWWPGLLNNLLKHSKRIQELHLNVPSPSQLPERLTLCTPHLENLEINFWQDLPERFVAITNGDKLPLHELKLAHCSLPWYSLNLSGLTVLSMCRVHSPSPPSMVQFLAILSNMRSLTALSLEYALPSARDFLSGRGSVFSPKVNLPHLALLQVALPVSTVAALLSCINIPSQTWLSLGPRFEPGSSAGDYAPISSFLSQQFRPSEQLSPSSPIFRSLAIYDDGSGVLIFSSLERDFDPRESSSERPGRDIPLEIILEDEESEAEPMSEIDRHRIMSDICCSLPLGNIQTLHVARPEFPSVIWKEIFGRLDGLRYMYLTSGYMPDLSMLFFIPHKLTENLEGQLGHDQDRTRVLAPALEELQLEKIYFVPDDLSSPRTRYWSEKSFLDAVATREGLRDRLTMIDCDVE